MVFSKSIIGSLQESGFTWLFCFHFAEKTVTLGQDFYSKLFGFHVLGRIQLFLIYVRVVSMDS